MYRLRIDRLLAGPPNNDTSVPDPDQRDPIPDDSDTETLTGVTGESTGKEKRKDNEDDFSTGSQSDLEWRRERLRQTEIFLTAEFLSDGQRDRMTQRQVELERELDTGRSRT